LPHCDISTRQHYSSSAEVRMVTYQLKTSILANRTTCFMIDYQCHNIICLSVWDAVQCGYKRCILLQKWLDKLIGSALVGARFYNCEPLHRPEPSKSTSPKFPSFHLPFDSLWLYHICRTARMSEQAQSSIGCLSNSWASCYFCSRDTSRIKKKNKKTFYFANTLSYTTHCHANWRVKKDDNRPAVKEKFQIYRCV